MGFGSVDLRPAHCGARAIAVSETFPRTSAVSLSCTESDRTQYACSKPRVKPDTAGRTGDFSRPDVVECRFNV